MSLANVWDRREKEPVILIAVMGATGTGKTTFINLVSGSNLGVGNRLLSCTSDIAYSHVFEFFGRRIILVDIPGFDDTTKSDTDILMMIAAHLSTAYEAGVKFSGVIYMHRISDFRMGGISRRNFNMFRKLCGEETLHNVLLVTTMWGLVDPQTGEKREDALKTDGMFFKPVLDKGAQMVRHDHTLKSARTILQRLVLNHPEPLRIQRELVDEKKNIRETGAGEELDEDLAAITQRHKEDLDVVWKEMDKALAEKDLGAVQELKDVRKRLVNDMEKVELDREKLLIELTGEMQNLKREIWLKPFIGGIIS